MKGSLRDCYSREKKVEFATDYYQCLFLLIRVSSVAKLPYGKNLQFFRRAISLKKLPILLCILMYLCSAALAMELDPEEFMTADKIKPGMKGTGKTVFEGTKVEEFQVEVLDVVKNALYPKSDVIWVVCSGGPLEEAGAISGMSGSPVYIDGKLIGAIAYRAPEYFVKRPIMGITPIADMMEILDDEKTGSGYSMLDTGYSNSELAANEPGIQHPVSSTQYPASLVPIQSPIALAGFHPRAIDDLAPTLKKLGMAPIQGGGTSSQAGSEEVPLEPGAVIGMQFMRGDASMFSYGTVTYVDGDKILAFGHPMYGMGKIALPMAGGRVSFLMPSLRLSAKYAAPAKTMGTLVYDDQYGIMGIVGKEPDFIPVKVRITSERSNQPQEYNFEIANHKLFTPTLISSTAASAIYDAEKTMGEYTIRTHSEINLKGHPTISKDNAFSGTAPGSVASALASPMYALMQNTFEEVDVESILLEMSFEDKRTTARIDGARISKDQIRPGDSLEVTVFLTPYMEGTAIKKFQVTVPEDMPEGRAFLMVFDAVDNRSWERTRAPMKSRVTNMPDLIKRILEEESNSDIIIQLFAQKVGVTIGDQELPALPLTTFSVMRSPRQTGDSGFTRGTTFLKQRVSTEYVISGSEALLLNIDRNAPY